MVSVLAAPSRALTRLTARPPQSQATPPRKRGDRFLKKFCLPFEPLGPRRSREIEKSERGRRGGEGSVFLYGRTDLASSLAAPHPVSLSLSPPPWRGGALHRDRPDAIGWRHCGEKKKIQPVSRGVHRNESASCVLGPLQHISQLALFFFAAATVRRLIENPWLIDSDPR